MTLKDRLADAMTRKGVSNADLARHLGVSRQAVSFWRTGRNEPAEKTLKEISDYLAVDPLWLKKGGVDPDAGAQFRDSVPREVVEEESLGDAYVAISKYRVDFSAGPGSECSIEEETNEEKRIFPRSLFLRHHVSPHNCRVFSVHGESMQPTLQDGDEILVDCTPCQPLRSGRIYCFAYRGEDRVKRLYPTMDGMMVIKSDNSDFPEERVQMTDWEQEAKLIGRVFHHSGSGGL